MITGNFYLNPTNKATVSDLELDEAIIKVTTCTNLGLYAVWNEIRKLFPERTEPSIDRVKRHIIELHKKKYVKITSASIECPSCGHWLPEFVKTRKESCSSDPVTKTELELLHNTETRRKLAFLLYAASVGGMREVEYNCCTPAEGLSIDDLTNNKFRFGGKFPEVIFTDNEAEQYIADLIEKGFLREDEEDSRYKIANEQLRKILKKCVVIFEHQIDLIELKWIKRQKLTTAQKIWYENIYGNNIFKPDNGLKERKKAIGIKELEASIDQLEREIEVDFMEIKQDNPIIISLMDFVFQADEVKRT